MHYASNKFVNTKAKEQSSQTFLQAMKKEIVTLTDLCGLIVEKEAEILDEEPSLPLKKIPLTP